MKGCSPDLNVVADVVAASLDSRHGVRSSPNFYVLPLQISLSLDDSDVCHCLHCTSAHYWRNSRIVAYSQ